MGHPVVVSSGAAMEIRRGGVCRINEYLNELAHAAFELRLGVSGRGTPGQGGGVVLRPAFQFLKSADEAVGGGIREEDACSNPCDFAVDQHFLGRTGIEGDDGSSADLSFDQAEVEFHNIGEDHRFATCVAVGGVLIGQAGKDREIG